MLILTLVGVAFLLRASRGADQSTSAEAGARTAVGAGGAAGGAGAAEVVVQLKYDGGELDRIYLTQYRQEPRPPAAVPSRGGSCPDLCFAGLGGRPCGRSCPKLMPVGLQMALTSENSTETPYGFPRVAVCPLLCEYNLGDPLCNCPRSEVGRPVDWADVCHVFCETDQYVLGGCPECQESSISSVTQTIQITQARILTTTEGWQSWCNVQCRQGQGGAACNCDRAPFQ